MSIIEEVLSLAGQAAGVSNSDLCLGPLAPTNSDSQSALDELDSSQVSWSRAIDVYEQHIHQCVQVMHGVLDAQFMHKKCKRIIVGGLPVFFQPINVPVGSHRAGPFTRRLASLQKA
jgi:hypothetical protein